MLPATHRRSPALAAARRRRLRRPQPGGGGSCPGWPSRRLGVHAPQTRTQSRRAWAPLAFTPACNVVLLASARANVVGPDIAREYRYQTESAALFVIGVGLACLPLLGHPRSTRASRDAEEGPTTQRRVRRTAVRRPGCVAIVVAVVVAAWSRAPATSDLWQDEQPIAGRTSTRSAAPWRPHDKPVPLVDIGIPQTLLWAYRYPENTYSHVFRDLEDQTELPRSVAGPALHLRRRRPPVPSRAARDPLEVPTEGCGFPLRRHHHHPPQRAGRSVAAGGCASPTAAPATWHAPRGRRRGSRPDLPEGLHNLFVSGAGRLPRSVTFSDYPSDTGLCVTALTLGLPEPIPHAG